MPSSLLGTLHPNTTATCYCPYFTTENNRVLKEHVLAIKTHCDQVVEIELEPRFFLVSTSELVKAEITGFIYTESLGARPEVEFKATKCRATGKPHHQALPPEICHHF